MRLVDLAQFGGIAGERVGVQHRELARPQRAGPWALLVPEDATDAEKADGQLAVGGDLRADQLGGRRLVGRGEDETACGSVLATQELRTGPA
jgi:hypothetical protein